MKKELVKLIRYLINKYFIFKEKLLCAENRRKNLTTILVLLVLHLILLISTSNAYYQNESGLRLLHAIVGDIDSLNYDYVLRIFIEDSNNDNKTYKLVNNIPTYNYQYSNYICNNNGELIYDSVNNTTSISLDGKESCSIYFDLISKPDIIVNIYLETDLDSNNYIRSDTIPNNINYELNTTKSECLDKNNNIINNNISYNNGLISIDTTRISNCEVYLDVANE